MTDYRRILFIKPSSLGDIVHAMPTLAAIRSAYPSATVTWLVKRQWAGLVERIAGVDRVATVDPGFNGWLSTVPDLRAQRFDVAVDLQGLLRSGLMAWASGAPERVGFANAREGSRWCYTRQVALPTPEMHAVDRYLLVAEALGAQRMAEPRFEFRPASSDHEAVQCLLQQAGLRNGSRWVAMNVSARWPTKRWPAQSFAALADRIIQEGKGDVVFIGGPDERTDVAAVMGCMKAKAIDLSGRTTVGQLPTLLSQASLLVTNDSGPLHVAAAVRTPVVALFGPTSPVRTGPYGPSHLVLTHQTVCSPCFSRSCTHSEPLACLTHVTPDQVFAAITVRFTAPVATSS